MEFDFSDVKQNTIPKRLKMLVESAPNREIFIFYAGSNREVLTFQQLWTLSGKMAALLKGQGFERHDVIANTIPNSPERLITDLGILLAGCISMNGQVLLADGDDFFSNARKSKCQGVVVCPEDWFPAWRIIGPYVEGQTSDMFTSMSSCEKAPEMKKAILVPSTTTDSSTGSSFLSRLEESDVTPYYEMGDPEDIFAVIATSGSTGYSKLVARTYEDTIGGFSKVDKRVEGPRDGWAKEDNSVSFNDRPLGWLGSIPFQSYLLNQRRLLMNVFKTKGIVSTSDVWNAVCAEKCSHARILPTLIHDIAQEFVTQDTPAAWKVDKLALTGEPMKQDRVSEALEISKAVIISAGSSEVSLLSIDLVKDASNFTNFYTGKVVPGLQIRIVDEKGNELECGKQGYIEAKGPTVFKGYFNKLEDPDPQTLKAFTEDGWFKTQDTGYLDDKGGLYIFGRTQDVICHKGFRLYPAWLEAKISEHLDVLEAMALPVPHPLFGHTICACAKVEDESQLTEEMLRNHCQNIFIAKLTDNTTPMPEHFKIIKSSDFPLTPNGKPDRMTLKKMVEEEFGQS